MSLRLLRGEVPSLTIRERLVRHAGGFFAATTTRIGLRASMIAELRNRDDFSCAEASPFPIVNARDAS